MFLCCVVLTNVIVFFVLSHHPWLVLALSPQLTLIIPLSVLTGLSIQEVLKVFQSCSTPCQTHRAAPRPTPPPPSPTQRGIVLVWLPHSPPRLHGGDLRGPFSSASESPRVVSAFPRGGWALPCDHAEILCALADGLLWKPLNGFRRTLSLGPPPQPLLGLASLTVGWAGAKQLCPRIHQHHHQPPPDTVIPPQTLPARFPLPYEVFPNFMKAHLE